MKAEELRTKKEKALFRLCFAFSLITWIILVVTLVGLVYGLMIGFFLFVAHALMIAYIKGNGIRLSEDQLPGIHSRVVRAAEALGMKQIPEVYIMQAGGMLNAFATKFLGRNFVVIYSDLLEACDEEGKEMDMIIGHELGHLALGHLKWILFLAPSKIVPWLGTAYSRACEYSCDRCGFVAAGDLESASRGLAILAGGGKYAGKVNMEAFLRQAQDTRGFWTSIFELNASHPFLPKRVAALHNFQEPGKIAVPGRHLLAYPLAPFLGFASPAGAAPLVAVAMIGIMAAVAIPEFQKFREKAMAAQSAALMDGTLEQIYQSASLFYDQNGKWPCSHEEMHMPDVVEVSQRQGWTLEVSCDYNYGAIIFPMEGKRHYKVLYFDSGERDEGVLEN